MTSNQRNILKTLKWIFFLGAILMIISFAEKFFDSSRSESSGHMIEVLDWIFKGILLTVFGIVAFTLISLIQHYFTKNIESRKTQDEAANAKLLMRLEIPNQFFMNLFSLLILCGFSVLLNTLLFSPETILDAEQINSLESFEKILFGFFYVLAHFLLVVFGARLIKGIPPLFLATERGFCYNPAGISTGWILWDDITEVRETEIIYGRSISTGPTLRPVLGIKLINPENYNNQAYAPLLKKLVDAGQKLNNFQTEGVGDVLLLPEDFGKNYGKVKSLFKDKTKVNVFKE